ncbi:MAG: PspC domain-containing protein [Candidatus Nomurabacteria bacterium]|jgi:phage shock protein PspC (stress-responsive transcriptional regulator)|nr:PspC domain-containing protein [Candidatus Nomurabacteria bacterium]
MNEISRIHLARVSYDIDVAAKKELEKYLSAVRRSLGKETDAMEDIEIRMTEILAERGVVQDSVVTESDIKAVIEQLGEPKNYAADDEVAADVLPSATKKYYRDPENAVLGGVVAGVSAYTGWDVTLLRILAVILAITPIGWGWLIILYIVVWVVAPEAKSVSKKMEMRGEQVNLETIKESARKMSEQAEKAGHEMAAKVGEAGKRIGKQAPRIGNVIGRLILAFCGVIGLLISASLLFGLVVGGHQALFWLSGADVAQKLLLIVTVALTIAFVSVAIILGFVMSIAMIVGKFSKGCKRGVLALVVAIVLLTTAAASLAANWTLSVGRDGVESTARQFVDDNIQRSEGGWCFGVCEN